MVEGGRLPTYAVNGGSVGNGGGPRRWPGLPPPRSLQQYKIDLRLQRW